MKSNDEIVKLLINVTPITSRTLLLFMNNNYCQKLYCSFEGFSKHTTRIYESFNISRNLKPVF